MKYLTFGLLLTLVACGDETISIGPKPMDPNTFLIPGVPPTGITAKTFETCYDQCGDKYLDWVVIIPSFFQAQCTCRDGSFFDIALQYNNDPNTFGSAPWMPITEE